MMVKSPSPAFQTKRHYRFVGYVFETCKPESSAAILRKRGLTRKNWKTSDQTSEPNAAHYLFRELREGVIWQCLETNQLWSVILHEPPAPLSLRRH